MSIVFISDCHLGYRHRRKTQRLHDYEKAFKESVDEGLKKSPSVFVFLGDLLHHSKPDPKSMRTVVNTLLRIAADYHVIVCIGNHEIEGHLGTAYTPIFADLHDNIHVLSTENPVVELEVDGEKILFHGFQFIRNRKLAEETLLSISENTGPGRNILCIHQAIEGYLSPFEISVKTLREVASKYGLIAVGHVHKHQKIKEVYDVTPAYYVGSTERVSFNEAANKTGFMVFGNDYRNPEYVEVASASMNVVSERLGSLKPSEINERVAEIIHANNGSILLQVNLDVDVDGDLLDMQRDYSENGFTICEVNVTPRLHDGDFMLEKLELSADTIREYFKKSGLGSEKELMDVSIELFEKYSG